MKTNVLVKVFTAGNGGYLGSLPQASVSSFEYRIDDGPGECVLTLPSKFDAVDPLVKLNRYYEIHVFDAAFASEPARVVYEGYVSLIEREISESGEGIKVHLLGHHTKMAMDVYRNGTTTTIAHSAVALGAVIKDILDKWAAATSQTSAKIYFASGTSFDVGMGPTVSYTFEEKTYREALDIARSYASGGQYFRFEPDGLFVMRAPSATADHSLTYGRHFTRISVAQSMEKIRNKVLFYNGVQSGANKIYKLYTAAPEVSQYGPRVERHYDYGVIVAATADAAANRFLADAKKEGVTLSVRIVSSRALTPHTGTAGARPVGYDIERFRPGDTVRFDGFDKDTEFLSPNMLITRVVYGFDWADLTIDPFAVGVSAWQKKTDNDISRLSARTMPTAYTT